MLDAMIADAPVLSELYRAQLDRYPQHEKFLAKRLAQIPPEQVPSVERIATLARRIAGDDLALFCEGYRWLCEAVFEEEIHFRRTGSYRLSKFEDALREVYGNHELMTKYMRGLLMTELWWSNHTQAMLYYQSEFLAKNRPGYAHLEVGPGHGLLLHMALEDKNSGDVAALDVSEASLDETVRALSLLGQKRKPQLVLRNLFSDEPWTAKYDSLVIAEVLEHVETPVKALQSLLAAANPGARIFVHMPANSPAPDHLYLVKSEDEVLALMTDAGWQIEDCVSYPSTGFTLESARKRQAAISVVAIGRAPG